MARDLNQMWVRVVDTLSESTPQSFLLSADLLRSEINRRGLFPTAMMDQCPVIIRTPDEAYQYLSDRIHAARIRW